MLASDGLCGTSTASSDGVPSPCSPQKLDRFDIHFVESLDKLASSDPTFYNRVCRVIEEGDVIDIDIPGGRIGVRVDDDTLARRRAAWTAPAPKETTGWLARYAKLVSGANEGAVMQK